MPQRHSTAIRSTAERRYPVTLFGVVMLVGFGWFVTVVPPFSETLLRVAVSVPLLLFAPGYALIAAIVPEQRTSTESGHFDGFGTLKRVIYSVILSIVLVPLIGFIVDYVSVVQFRTVFIAISVFTVGSSGAGIYRWWSLPPRERFSLGVYYYATRSKTELFKCKSTTDCVLSGILLLSLVVAGGSIAFGATTTHPDAGHSQLFLVTETENGTFVMDDYPTDFIRGESRPLVVGIVNEEHKRTHYTVRLLLQRVNGTNVTENRVLREVETTVRNGNRWTKQMSFAPTMAGDHLRLVVELYVNGKRTATAEPDDTIYLWITVSERGTTSSQPSVVYQPHPS